MSKVLSGRVKCVIKLNIDRGIGMCGGVGLGALIVCFEGPSRVVALVMAVGFSLSYLAIAWHQTRKSMREDS
jgi:hypothetical protein